MLPTQTRPQSTPRRVSHPHPLSFLPHPITPLTTPTVAEEEAPSGMLARGHYTAISTFVDDDKKKHLEFEWAFDIAKDW